jgi:hypothetical protein
MVVFGLSSSREVVNSCNGLENLGIGIEMAAVARGQDMPFFEVGEGVFNKDPAFCRISKNSAASEFGIASLLGNR